MKKNNDIGSDLNLEKLITELKIYFDQEKEDEKIKLNKRVSKIEKWNNIIIGILLITGISSLILFFVIKSSDFSPTVQTFIVASSLVILGYVSSLQVTRKSIDLHKKTYELSVKGLEDIKTQIREQLTPTVSAHSGLTDVTETATAVLDRVLREEKPEHKFVCYFGAPSLSSTEDDTASEEAEITNKILKKYEQSQTNLFEKGVNVKRYINLSEADSLKSRDKALLEKYKNWLDKQSIKLESHDYEILKARRAPAYESTYSYIITYRSYLQIVGIGEAAIHVSSPVIVSKILGKMRDVINNAKKEENKPKKQTKDNLLQLIKELGEINKS